MSMITCPHCGNNVSYDNGTCFICGGDLPKIQQTKTGNPVPPPPVQPVPQKPLKPDIPAKKTSPVVFFAIFAAVILLLCVAVSSSQRRNNKKESERLAEAVSEAVQEEPEDIQETIQEETVTKDPDQTDTKKPDAIEQQKTETQEAETIEPAQVEVAAADTMTISQKNAVQSAKEYLSFSAFSRLGLIRQLSSEYGSGFSEDDATFAVNYLEYNGLVDWNEQAVKAAEEYLSFSSFSRDGLIEQLSSEAGSQFTREQAEYAVSQVGF